MYAFNAIRTGFWRCLRPVYWNEGKDAYRMALEDNSKEWKIVPDVEMLYCKRYAGGMDNEPPYGKYCLKKI